jgi:ribosomal protein L16 Arg81 hydroxylase
MSARLSALLEPVPVDEFLARYWRKQHLFRPGTVERCSGLLTWTELNKILEHHWRETVRFRLALRGRDLDQSAYADMDISAPKIRSKDVTDHLRRGATLSFDAIDEVHEPLTDLAKSFEAVFRGGTKINIYAAWRAVHGLDLHRDNQEIFILQLDGRKRWLLYGVSVDGVDRTELGDSSVPPAGASFDQILAPGDLLYIPRGCYHLAVPLNEPALHLTIGVKNPRGVDLAEWMVKRLRASGIANRDLPYHDAADARRRYNDELRTELLSDLDGDLVQEYLADTGSNFKPRSSFSLPWSAMPEGLPAGRDFVIKLNPAHVIVTNNGNRALEIVAGGRRCRFPRAMKPVLEHLSDGSPAPLNELIDGLAGQLDEGAVRLLLAMLVKQNLVAIVAE